MPHTIGKLMALAPIIGLTAMLAPVDEYVETLPKMRRALMPAGLLVAGGFGGGIAVSTVGVRQDLARFDVEHKQIFSLISDDTSKMAAMRREHQTAIRAVTEAISNLTCDINNIPNARCEWWIDNGRPSL